MATKPPVVHRARTAMARQRLSMPARTALDDEVITPATTVLDYGCGKGDDLRHLAKLGVAGQGWDPHYRPDPPAAPADVVLLTYVLNVIEDLEERKSALVAAMQLARRCLVASIRLRWEESSIPGADHQDGVVTSRGTFQALFRPEEFRLWTHLTTGVRPISPRPEVVYLFTDVAARTHHLHRRFRRPIDTDLGVDPLRRLAAHLRDVGRLPRPYEAPGLCEQLTAAYGTLRRAGKVAEHLLPAGAVAVAAKRRKADLIVALAMDAFHGRPRFSELPQSTQADVRAFFSSHREARNLADKLLVAAGQPNLIKRAAASSRTGKLTPTALYVHVSALDQIVPLLRVYEACARLIAGAPEGANIVKLHHDQPAVSYLAYPHFDDDPHPRLDASLFVHIAKQQTTWTAYDQSVNRPLLHRKEEFVAADHADTARWRRLTKREEAYGLYDDPSRIGRDGLWTELLAAKGLAFSGHRLIVTG